MNSNDRVLIKELHGVDIEKIVASYSESKWSQGGIAHSRYKYSTDLKKSTDLRDASSAAPCLLLQDFVTKEVEPILHEYSKNQNIGFYKTEYQLVRYKEGQFFKEHVDATEEFPRKISILIYLNSNYSGGEIVFSKLSMSIKPEKNTLIMFPSSEEFSHSAEPIKSGTKYVIVGFAS
jgi:Rps23 Pro-64 3,4-dihydroxylase Tpa1-like proline 4-hydroxylase